MSEVKVAISQDFMLAFAKVPPKAQKKVMEFVTKFRHNPRSSGINYEKLNDAKDDRYRSVRIDQNYRGIVLKPDQGNVFLLLWVDKHDDAYHWARRHRCEVHPETGVLQIFESQSLISDELAPALLEAEPTEPVVQQELESREKQPTPIFSLSNDQFLSIGVPSELLPLAKAIQTEADLEAAERQLPVGAFEALYLHAAGTGWDEITKEYGSTRSDAIDPEDLVAALDHPESQRSFHVVEDELELKEMLEAPLEHWRVFLHPSQRKLVNRNWNGPVRVLGGAGTGKTVVAMHRAKWLVNNLLQKSDQRILFTTFTANLATDIENNLRKICTTDEHSRIEIKHIDRWVSQFLKRNHYPHRIVYPDRDKDYDTIWKLALQLTPGEPGLPDTFYKEEWERIILPQRVMTKTDYFKASRKGRGVALSRKQRADIWPVFEELRTQLHQKGLRTFEDATLDAVEILNSKEISLPYRSIIVDEAQDMGPEALTLIRQIVQEVANDIFIVGDGHQRIYRRKTTMSGCGIKIVGRSHKLRINYRTTEETRRFATAVLEDIPIDDLDGGQDSSKDYRSLMHGERPEIQGFSNIKEEAKGIVEKIRALQDSGEAPHDICVTARTRRIRDEFAQHISTAGLEVVTLEQQNDNRSIPGVRLATMHRVKGLEFRFIFIVSVNDGVIPLRIATTSTEDPVEAKQRDLNERALLHVSATRAIKKLYISYSSKSSPYLKDGYISTMVHK